MKKADYFKSLVQKILEQTEEDQWFKIDSGKYMDILRAASYNTKAISRLPKFKNKKIWIVGDLNLRGNKQISSLEGIHYIQGRLDISSTNISNIDHIQVTGSISDWDSGVSRIRQQKIKNQKISDAKERREYQEYELEANTNESNNARAIFEHIISDEGLSSDQYLTDEDEKRLNELYMILENLSDKRQEYDEQGLDTDEIDTDEEAAQDEIDELESRFSIYHLIPDGDHYELQRFEIIGYDDLEGQSYCSGDYREAEQSAKDSIRSIIDDVGYDGYSDWVLEDNINKDKVEDYARDFYDNDVRDNPESYFDDDDYELSDEQEAAKERLEAEIADLEEKQNNLEHEIEEPSDYSDAYDEVQEKIDNLQEMLDEMEPDKEPSEEMIENKVDELVDQAMNDPISWLKDLGYEIKDFIDEDSMVDYVFDSDGFSTMSSYDGDYNTVYVNDIEYYVFRLD